MAKWFKLSKTQYFGLFAFGFVLFAVQELPYIIMPMIPLASNPLMEMQDKSILLNFAEKALGISCIIVMLFLVCEDDKWFSLSKKNEKLFFVFAIAALIGYYIGWAFYWNGYQGLPLILGLLVAMPPVYYALIGLWRRNYILSMISGLFLLAHYANVWVNLTA